MTLAEIYRERFHRSNVVTVMDWALLLREVDANAKLSSRPLGCYIEFSDGSIWLMGAAERNASCMKV